MTPPTGHDIVVGVVIRIDQWVVSFSRLVKTEN